MVIYCKGYDRNGHCFGQLLNVSNQGCGDLVVGSPLKLFIFNINKWSANRGPVPHRVEGVGVVII